METLTAKKGMDVKERLHGEFNGEVDAIEIIYESFKIL